MSNELTQNVVESRDGMQQLLSTVDQVFGELDAGAAELASQQTTLEQVCGTIEITLRELATAVDSVSDTLGSEGGATVREIATASAGLEEAAGNLGDLRLLLDAKQQSLKQSAEIHREGFQVCAESVNSALDKLRQSRLHLEDELSALRERTTESFDSLSQAAELSEQTFNELRQETESELSELVSEVGEAFTSNVSSLFEEFSGELTEERQASLIEAVSQGHENLADGWDKFVEGTEAAGGVFSDRLQELAESITTTVNDSIKTDLEQAFESAQQNALDAFAKETVVSLATAQAGAATTSALAPLLPELVAAKAITSTLKSALSLFGG